MLDKTLKIIWLIVGIILLAFLAIVIVFGIKELLKPNQSVNHSLIIGTKLKNAFIEGKALQGLQYRQFERIGRSSNYYLPISSMTYEEARDFERAVNSAADISYGLANVINIMFLDSTYNVINTLVDFKAIITEINYPYRLNEEDTTKYKFSYLIGTTDSNKNGFLDREDHQDLYVSDINGKRLNQVSENIDIKEFKHIRKNTQLLISFFERNEKKKEHRRIKFALYDFKLDSLWRLNHIDKELDKIEQILIRNET